MPKHTKIILSLPHSLAEYIREIVDRGVYESPSEFVSALIRERKQQRREVDKRYRERLVPRNSAHLKQMIQEGIDSGPSVPAEEVFARLQAKFGKMAKQRTGAVKSNR